MRRAILLALVGTASLLAGAVASVAGFGIGSILTPLVGARSESNSEWRSSESTHWKMARHREDANSVCD